MTARVSQGSESTGVRLLLSSSSRSSSSHIYIVSLALCEPSSNHKQTHTHTHKHILQSQSLELQSLQRVSHRLVLTDSDEKFTIVIKTLLPKLLVYLGKPSNSPPIQSTLLQIISHILSRLKTSQTGSISLPLQSLINLLYTPPTSSSSTPSTPSTPATPSTPSTLLPVSSYTLNFTLTFLSLTLPTPNQPPSTIPFLIKIFNSVQPISQQADMISHILLECIKDKHEKGENVEDEIRNVIKESKGEND